MTVASSSASARRARRVAVRLGPLVLAVAGLMLLAHAPLFAQQVALTVTGTMTVEAPSQTAFPIGVTSASSIPRNSFVKLRGLPPMAAVSDGHALGPGAWAISLAGLQNLKLTVPANAVGRYEIALALVDIEGKVLAEAKMTLVAVAQGQTGANSPTGGGLRAGNPAAVQPREERPRESTAVAALTMTPQDRERATRLLKRGQEQLEDANVSGARLFFEKAADAGLPEAALALGSTFDANELDRLNIRGAYADEKEARRWYERAAQLGAPEAQQRLQKLGKK